MLEHDRSFRGIGTAVATISAIVIAIIGSFYAGSITPRREIRRPLKFMNPRNRT